MKPALLLALIATAAIAVSAPKETPAQKDARMKWWKDARFGLFLHWGTYAVPAGEWHGNNSYAEWIREEAHIPVGQYEEFAKEFDPVKFDADKWVSMAKNAGMKYIVITSKHHEGFNMFASKYTDYNIMNTPFHRDPMKELAAACKKQGMKFCFYHSIMDWHHPDYLPRRSWEVKDRPAAGADFDRFNQYLQNDVAQLLTDYGPIGVMWFDGEWEPTWNHKYGQALYDLCRKIQPNVIVNNRVDVGRAGVAGMSTEEGTAGDYGTPEQEIPAQGIPGSYWETCMTMNDHWGYNKDDHDYKSSQDLIHKLVDIASKGGNFLLNIGPTAEGEFPPMAQERLADLGNWMHVNSRAIYDTDASPFPTLPWGRCTRGTVKGHTVLYLDVFDWPTEGTLLVPGIGNTPIKAYLLAAPGTPLKVSRQDSDLVIDVPSAAPDPNCSVVALEIQGDPIVYRTPTIQAPTSLVVQPLSVVVDPGSPQITVRFTLDGSDPTATSALYDRPVVIADDADLKVRAFDHDRPVSAVAEQHFHKTSPDPAVDVPSPLAGIGYQFYKGAWDNVPNFESLDPADSGTLTQINVDKWPQLENFGLHLKGYIRVPQDGVYNFQLASDDGSRLQIDSKILVDNDGLHSMTAKSGSAALAKGFHAVSIDYFNKTGGLGLALQWGLAGQPLKPIAAGELFH